MKVYHLPYSVISHPVVIGKLWYVTFCDRIFDFSLVLCFFMEWRRGRQDICASGYRLCSVVKCVVSSVVGNSSL